jgi:hypothetical protein
MININHDVIVWTYDNLKHNMNDMNHPFITTLHLRKFVVMKLFSNEISQPRPTNVADISD